MRDIGHPRIALNLFVDDLNACRNFYDQIFDAPVVHEDSVSVAFRFYGTTVYLIQTVEAARMVAPHQVGARGQGARFVLSVFVDDVDNVYSAACARGLHPNSPPIDRAWGMRTFTFSDPAGHCWEMAQSINMLATATSPSPVQM